jgi:hypothetical protein
MLRVEKHRKGESDHLRNLRQLKDARLQLKRVRRANKKALRLAQKSQPRPLTVSQLQARKDEADFQLLRSVWFEMLEADDFQGLSELIEDGFVLPPDAESEAHRLSAQGYTLYTDLKKRRRKAPPKKRTSRPATH